MAAGARLADLGDRGAGGEKWKDNSFETATGDEAATPAADDAGHPWMNRRQMTNSTGASWSLVFGMVFWLGTSRDLGRRSGREDAAST